MLHKIKGLKLWLLMAITAIAMSGCASTSPTTSKEFRNAVAGSSMATQDSFVVNRPYYQVVNTLQKNSKKCLNKSIKNTSTTHNGYYMQTSTNTMHYKTNFKKGRTLSSLEIKANSASMQSGITTAIYGETLRDGYFIAVVDVHKKGSNQTQVNIYRGSMLFGANKTIIKAVKSWVNTGSRSCPNLAQ